MASDKAWQAFSIEFRSTDSATGTAPVAADLEQFSCHEMPNSPSIQASLQFMQGLVDDIVAEQYNLIHNTNIAAFIACRFHRHKYMTFTPLQIFPGFRRSGPSSAVRPSFRLTQ